MKLDMDLVRAILQKVEEAPANTRAGRITVEGYDEDVVTEHVELLTQRGLLEASIAPGGFGGKRIAVISVRALTWEGHEFLGNARNESTWNKTKELIKEKGGSVSFDVLKAVLSKVA